MPLKLSGNSQGGSPKEQKRSTDKRDSFKSIFSHGVQSDHPEFSENLDGEGKNTDLFVSMFGNFTLHQADKDEDDAIQAKLGGRSRRLWTLIAYLIINRERGVSSTELIDMLWPDVSAANPQTKLQNNISRARAALDTGGIDNPRDLIVFENGLYWWAPDRKTLLDAEVFEKAVRMIGPEISEDAVDRALAICDLYKGDFLTQADHEPWCTSLNIYYRSLFTNFASRVLKTLLKLNRLSDAKRLCLRVIDVDPTIEEFNVCLMKCLTAEGNPGKAIEHYERMKVVYHDTYGVQIPPELEIEHDMAVNALYGNNFSKQAIIDFFNDADLDDGAFLCNMAVFREIVQLHVRMLHRSGEESQLVSIGVEVPENVKNHAERSAVNAKRLEGILQKTLRSGDPFSKMGRDQFLILLSGAGGEDGDVVVKRIIDAFHREYPRAVVKFRVWQSDLNDIQARDI